MIIHIVNKEGKSLARLKCDNSYLIQYFDSMDSYDNIIDMYDLIELKDDIIKHLCYRFYKLIKQVDTQTVNSSEIKISEYTIIIFKNLLQSIVFINKIIKYNGDRIEIQEGNN